MFSHLQRKRTVLSTVYLWINLRCSFSSDAHSVNIKWIPAFRSRIDRNTTMRKCEIALYNIHIQFTVHKQEEMDAAPSLPRKNLVDRAWNIWVNLYFANYWTFISLGYIYLCLCKIWINFFNWRNNRVLSKQNSILQIRQINNYHKCEKCWWDQKENTNNGKICKLGKSYQVW